MANLKKRLSKFAKSSPLLLAIFIAIPILTIGIGFLKLATGNTQTVYVKLKVSPGLWWAHSQNPDQWLAEGIKKGDKEYNLLGNATAEVMQVRYYPIYENEDKFDVFVTAKLEADYNKQADEYSYGRSPVVVGSPIEINLETVQLTGTVTKVYKEEPENQYVEKIIYITKKLAYPWEYQAVRVDDQYFDGEEVVFEVLAKDQVSTEALSPDYFGNFLVSTTERNRFITIRARAKLKEENGKYFFGEENILNPGSKITISTPNYYFIDYYVSRIEDVQE